MTYKRKDKIGGFTLIELIVALGIVGIISAIAVPKVYGVLEDSRIKACAVSRDYIVKELYTNEAMGILKTDPYGNIELDDKYKCPSNYEYMARVKSGKIEALCKEHNKEEYYKYTLNIVNEIDGFTSYLNGLGANKDSVQAGKDNNNKEITSMLNKVTNMGVTYWINDNNKKEVNWTSIDISDEGTHYIPVITYSKTSNTYSVWAAKAVTDENGSVKFEKYGGTNNISPYGLNGKDKDFEYMRRYYDKAVELFPNYDINNIDEMKKFTNAVRESVTK